MTKSISRAQFLRGDFRGEHRYIRPPWSEFEQTFTRKCTRCNACLQTCPEQILISDPRGFPRVDFSRGECSFCGECAQACKDDVLKAHTTSLPWSLAANITDKCLPLQGVVCGRCAEECEVAAISMKLVAGGISIPRLASQVCTGCGACYRTCPTNAIEFSYDGAPHE